MTHLETHIKSSQYSLYSVINDYFTVPASHKQQRRLQKQQKDKQQQQQNEPKPDAWHYILTPQQLQDNKFPTQEECEQMLQYDQQEEQNDATAVNGSKIQSADANSDGADTTSATTTATPTMNGHQHADTATSDTIDLTSNVAAASHSETTSSNIETIDLEAVGECLQSDATIDESDVSVAPIAALPIHHDVHLPATATDEANTAATTTTSTNHNSESAHNKDTNHNDSSTASLRLPPKLYGLDCEMLHGTWPRIDTRHTD